MRGSRGRLASHTWGGLPLVNHFLDRLGLDATLGTFLAGADRRTRLAPGRAIGVLVRNVVLSRRPLYALGEWAGAWEPALLGLSARERAELNDDRFGRALDRLFDADRPSLVVAVAVQAVREFGLELAELHNDSTTVTFHGAYRGADGRAVRGKPTAAITWGHNKDHRPDLKQLLWQLTITADGAVPVHYHVHPGNTADDTTHVATWEVLRELVGDPGFLYVSDCKLCAAEAMRHIDRRGGTFLTVLPRTRREEGAFRAWIAEHEVPWQKLWERPAAQAGGPPADGYQGFQGPPSAEGFRILWIHSRQKERRDAEARQDQLDRASLALTALQARLASPRSRLRRREQLDRAVQAALGDAARWLAVEVHADTEAHFRQERRGRPGPRTRYRRIERPRFRLTWRVDQETLRRDARADGIFPLITNDRQRSMRELLTAYKRQPEVEKRHEQLKHTHQVAPQYLKGMARIEALLCVYFLALLTHALIERELRRAMAREGIQELPLYPEARDCRHPTTERVLELFETVQVHRLRRRGQPQEVFGPQLTRLQKRLLKLLGVPRSRYRPS